MEEMQLQAKVWKMLHPLYNLKQQQTSNIKQRQAKNLISMYME